MNSQALKQRPLKSETRSLTLVKPGLEIPIEVTKRNAQTVKFDVNKIYKAIELCYASLENPPKTTVETVVQGILSTIATRWTNSQQIPTVEQIQDIVETTLLVFNEFEAAKHYILYRAEHAQKRVIIPEDVRKAFDEDKQYFASNSQRFMFYDKYSRYDWEKKRRETWPETVKRNIDYMRWLVETKSTGTLPESTWGMIYDYILQMKAMPSMRSLSQAGESAKRNPLAIYNCSYFAVDSIESFSEGMFISMSGAGAGYSVERQFVEKFPRIIRQNSEPAIPWIVDDTTEGWVSALKFGLKTWFNGGDVNYDYSLLRPAGAVLITKGGRSSGPEPLKQVLNFCRTKILSRQGSFLRPLDCHDMMCVTLGAAISGGVRRTAAISLFDWDDHEMLTCKNGNLLELNPWRWNANNSVVWPDEGPTQLQLIQQMTTMVENYRGEPGIFSRANATKTAPARRNLSNKTIGTNPCHSGSMRLMTLEYGMERFDNLSGKTFQVWNGTEWSSSRAWETGTKDVYRVTLRNGQQIELTEDHRLACIDYVYPKSYSRPREVEVRVADLVPGTSIRPLLGPGVWTGKHLDRDTAILYGLCLGDGYTNASNHIVYMKNSEPEVMEFIKKYAEHRQLEWHVVANDIRMYGLHDQMIQDGWSLKENLPDRVLPESFYNLDSQSACSVLKGLFSANGGAMPKHARIDLKTTCHALARQVQDALIGLGFSAYITTNGPQEIAWHNGTYVSRESYDVNISGASQYQEFQELIGFLHAHKSIQIESGSRHTLRATQVSSVELIGSQKVYDFIEPKTHWGWVNGLKSHNCGEIILRNRQLCNLSIAVARHGDTEQDLMDKVKVASIIGTIQALATDFPILSPEWQKNCEEERLLGVDINGIQDNQLLSDPNNTEMLIRLKEHAVATNAEYAKKLNCNQSASVTCDKPNGNSSQLLDCSNGIMPRWSEYYIRRFRLDAHGPLFKVLQASGVPLSPENGQTAATATSWVASFPIKSPDGAKTRHSFDIIEQCETWLRFKKNWTEHNPSVTCTYDPDEVLSMIDWVWKNRDMVGGMSFLPNDNAQYSQMPFEEITKEQYETLLAELPDIDYALLHVLEQTDMTEASQTLACSASAGQC